MLNKFMNWMETPSGRKVNFYLDMTHAINVLAIMLPLGYITKVGNVIGGKWAVMFLVLTAIHSMYCAQKYYSANYRY